MSLDVRSLTSRMMIGNLDMALFLVMRPNPQSFTKTSRKISNETLTNTGWVDTHWGNSRDTITVQGVTYSKLGNPDQYSTSEYATSSLSSFVDNLVVSDNNSGHGPSQWANIDRFILKLEQIYKTDKERVGSLRDLYNSTLAGTVSSAVSKVRNIFGSDTESGEESEESQDRDDLLTAINNGTAARAQSFIIYNYCIYWGFFTNFEYRESATDKPRQYNYSFSFKVVNSTTDWFSQSLINSFPEKRILNLFTQVGDLTTYAGSLLSSDKLLKSIMI